eukprot:TRINITY_DN3576_c0_g1_i1.p1 TRINITY_DN3576_c0_g1~~TRINITY_DN3576_c0_g1_i1.p1  ORF type:complete len:156 (-),score=23.84 TRINITY_DN3576_c0_g1_i1:34-501(-)
MSAATAPQALSHKGSSVSDNCNISSENGLSHKSSSVSATANTTTAPQALSHNSNISPENRRLASIYHTQLVEIIDLLLAIANPHKKIMLFTCSSGPKWARLSPPPKTAMDIPDDEGLINLREAIARMSVPNLTALDGVSSVPSASSPLVSWAWDP